VLGAGSADSVQSDKTGIMPLETAVSSGSIETFLLIGSTDTSIETASTVE
jgi:hypothetical protein